MCSFDEKSGGKKSHATVPLIRHFLSYFLDGAQFYQTVEKLKTQQINMKTIIGPSLNYALFYHTNVNPLKPNWCNSIQSLYIILAAVAWKLFST